MLERRTYPAGVPCWIDTDRRDPAAALDFYGGLFGWEFVDRTPVGATGAYHLAQLHGHAVAAVAQVADTQTADSQVGAPVWNTYIAVDDVERSMAAAEIAGGHPMAEVVDVGEAGRMAVVADPTGAAVRLWEAGQHHGAVLVNAPNTWNWSDLQTTDPDAATAFYTALFGWVAEAVVVGAGGITMWRLPGYGDFLEQLEPDLRRRQGDAGVPSGFEDAVAWLISIGPSADDVAARWGVTFAVDDTEAVAHRATELGGTVLVAPYDAGAVTSAVLADSEGAVFSVNTFRPD